MRTVLYANAEVSTFLRENFVLLWSSERPVPKVTIDFGDGRVLQRTLTGNAVHYVLDSEGRPLDAVPGLYGPQAFIAVLTPAAKLHSALADASTERADRLALYHRARAAVLDRTLMAFEDRPHRPGSPDFESSHDDRLDRVLWHKSRLSDSQAKFLYRTGDYPVVLATYQTVTKARGEGDLIHELLHKVRPDVEQTVPAHVLSSLSDGERQRNHLDHRSLALMAREIPAYHRNAPTAEGLSRVSNAINAERAIREITRSKNDIQAPIARVVRPADALLDEPSERQLARMADGFRRTLAADTARNEYDFHARIHHWFSSGEVTDLESLNARVYAEIFLTPRSDPWLGLGAEGLYTGTESGGRK